MIKRRIIGSAGPTGIMLYAQVEREQLLNIKLFMPATVIFGLLTSAAMIYEPEFFIEQGGHIIIALL